MDNITIVNSLRGVMIWADVIQYLQIIKHQLQQGNVHLNVNMLMKSSRGVE
jgi:hypothetical protein